MSSEGAEPRREPAIPPGLFEDAADVVYAHDLSGRILWVNHAAEAATGFARDELIGMSIADIVAPESLGLARRMMSDALSRGETATYEVAVIRKDGSRVSLEVGTRLVFEAGAPVVVQGIARDVSARRAELDSLRHLALHDALTGLPNRTLLDDRLAHAIRAARRSGESVALLMIDLDGFKAINDSLGHERGDLLLREVADRIRASLRDSDTVARFGGDEFVVVLPDAPLGGAVLAARKIRRMIEEPISAGGHTAGVGASVGISLFPDHAPDAQSLVRQADLAMYAAKAGDGVAVCGGPRVRPASSRASIHPALVRFIRRARDLEGELAFTANFAAAMVREGHPRAAAGVIAEQREALPRAAADLREALPRRGRRGLGVIVAGLLPALLSGAVVFAARWVPSAPPGPRTTLGRMAAELAGAGSDAREVRDLAAEAQEMIMSLPPGAIDDPAVAQMLREILDRLWVLAPDMARQLVARMTGAASSLEKVIEDSAARSAGAVGTSTAEASPSVESSPPPAEASSPSVEPSQEPTPSSEAGVAPPEASVPPVPDSPPAP